MTLTQAATITKRSVWILSIVIFLSVFSKVGYDFYQRYQLAHTPPVEEKPESKFGVLPKLTFPPSKVSSSNFSYRVDTTTGELPQVPKLVKVYFIPKTATTLLASDRAKKTASAFNFNNGPLSPTPDQYTFTDDKNNNLSIDIPTGNFHFQKAIASDSAQLKNPLPTTEAIVGDFKNFLSKQEYMPQDLADGRSQVNINQNDIVSTASITLWPINIDDIPIVTSDYNQGLIKATVTSNDDPIERYTRVDYTYWPVDKTTSSTYQIKTPQQALDDLKSGQGFISITPSNPEVSLTKISLAYLEGPDYTPYLQPVYVFEGSGFVALVPAIPN